MKTSRTTWLLVAVALLAGVGIGWLFGPSRTSARAAADKDAPMVSPRYTVVESQAHNAIVVDNQTNTLYFYAIDKDGKVGDPVKLRGTVDLNQVGKPSITPKPYKADEK